MPHPAEHRDATRALSASEADELGERLRALGSPGRLRMLTALLAGDRTVEELAEAAELSPSAASHHLRILRALRLVRARRDGRHVRYALHDEHLADLLAAVRHHHEHLTAPGALELPAAPVRSR